MWGFLIKKLKNTILRFLTAVGLLILGTGFALALFFRRIFTLLSPVFNVLGFPFRFIFRRIVDRLIRTVMMIGAIALALFIFWEHNPVFRQQMQQLTYNVEHFTRQYLGISLPRLPSPKAAANIVGNALMDKLPNQPETLTNVLKNYHMDFSIPTELQPLLNVAQTPEALQRYVPLITSGEVYRNIDSIVPTLSQQLYSSDKAVKTAAYQSLWRINSAEARNALRVYRNQLEKTLNNATKNSGN